MWGAIAGAVIGGMMSQDAASSASSAQTRSAREATAAQREMFDKQVALQEPFRQTGLTANNRLAYLLGLSTDSGVGGQSQSPMTYEQIRNQLAPQYSSKNRELQVTPFKTDEGVLALGEKWVEKDVIDEAALDSAIREKLKQNDAINAQRLIEAQGDTQFGSLMRDFSMADFEQDPGYEFRRTEGLKGVEGGAAARGGLLSGGALKAIQKYGQDLASQEYGNAFNRFTGQQTNKYNRLAGVVNTGQGATNQVANAAGNFGSQMGSNIIGAGNAQAAGIVGGANAWNNAIGQGVNAYQSNQLMDLIKRPSGSSGGSSNAYVDQYYG